MIDILEKIKETQMNIHELFIRTQDKFNNLDEFIYSLDVLYILDAIEVDFINEQVTYVKRTKM